MTPTRRLAAIMAADVAGFSAAMERDEEGTFALVQELRGKIIEPKIAEHTGRLVKTTGDGFLAEFASPIAAMRCALAIQSETASGPLQLRIGLNLGDVIVEESGDVYGEGVNVAARLEALADPGGILISGKVHSEIEGKVEAAFEDRGEQQVKNIARPVRAYAARIASVSATTSAAIADVKSLPLPDKPSIAVLPFQNMSGDPEQEYFADGMVEDIITALSRFKSLFVIARNSSFTYKGKAVDVKQVGRELGVRYVLEGSVRRAGSRLRITGQLIEAASNKHLWADRFEGSLDDIFELQDSITASVVGAIRPQLAQAELDVWKTRQTSSLDSHDMYMRAQTASRERRLSEAVLLYRKCTELDPTFALASARAANCIRVIYWNQLQPVSENDLALAIELADDALRLGNDDAEVLAFVSTVFVILKNEVEQGYDLAVRATDLNPNHAVAWGSRGLGSIFLGEHQRALDEFDHALRLNPIDRALVPAIYWGKAAACLFLDRYTEGIEYANKILLFQPTHMMGLINLAMQSHLAGREGQAQRAIQLLRKAYPDLTSSYLKHQTYLGFYRRLGDNTKLIEAFGKLGLPE